MTACTKPGKDKAKPYMERESSTISWIATGLSTVDGCCERKNRFSLRMWPLVGWPCSSGWLHSQPYMSSTNWTWWILQQRAGGRVEPQERWRWILEGLGVNMSKMYCMKVLKNNKNFKKNVIQPKRCIPIIPALGNTGTWRSLKSEGKLSYTENPTPTRLLSQILSSKINLKRSSNALYKKNFRCMS